MSKDVYCLFPSGELPIARVSQDWNVDAGSLFLAELQTKCPHPLALDFGAPNLLLMLCLLSSLTQDPRSQLKIIVTINNCNSALRTGKVSALEEAKPCWPRLRGVVGGNTLVGLSDSFTEGRKKQKCKIQSLSNPMWMAARIGGNLSLCIVKINF